MDNVAGPNRKLKLSNVVRRSSSPIMGVTNSQSTPRVFININQETVAGARQTAIVLTSSSSSSSSSYLGIGSKKYFFLYPPLIGSEAGMEDSYATLEDAAALGYNGVVVTMTTGTQYATETIWKGGSPGQGLENWPINAAAFRQKCTDLGLEFILGTFMAVTPNEGGYAPMDPIYWESMPVKNQQFKVVGSDLVVDDSVVRFQLANLSWDGSQSPWDGEYEWWGPWRFYPQYGYAYSQLLNGEWSGTGPVPHHSYEFPVYTTRDYAVIPPDAGTDAVSLKWTVPDAFTWQSGTAYTTGKVIAKNGRVFYAYIGGTSGGVEPNWSDASLVENHIYPASIDGVNDKLVDGGVTWAYQGADTITLNSGWIFPPDTVSIYNNGNTDIIPNSYIDFAFDLKLQSSQANRIEFEASGYTSDILGEGTYWYVSEKVYLTNWWYQHDDEGDVGGTRVETAPGSGLYNMDWTHIHIPFNTIDAANAILTIRFVYVDGNGIRTEVPNPGAQVWISNITTKPAGIVNIMRKDKTKGDPTYSTPIYVRSLDGNTTYVEGPTGDFDNAEDTGINLYQPQLWVIPLDSDWEAVPVMTLPVTSRLSEGDTVLMDYYHIGFQNSGVWPCFAEPALYDFYEGYIPKALTQWHPDAWFIETSEVRMLGWDKTCADVGTVGQVLASHIDRLTTLVKAADPGKPIYVWSDMWDETHNGSGREYLLATDVDGSWEGLHSDTIIFNWFKEIPSLDFFFNKNFEQVISSYYDNSDFVADEAALFVHAALLGPDMISGAMYTTWSNPQNYSKLAEYMDMIISYEA